MPTVNFQSIDDFRSINDLAPQILEKVRNEVPLIHHMTNLVVTNVTANVTLAIGASPVMADAAEEVQDMAAAARALVLNIGTLTPGQVDAMILAGKAANAKGIPVILDPVGAGATPLRTKSVDKILSEVKISILRGNEAEVSQVGGFGGIIRGVDSVEGHRDKRILATETARKLGCVVAVTGPEDYISDGKRVAIVRNGHPMLRLVTGTGCMATSVIAAFAAVEKDMLLAAAAALACYGYAAEEAASRSFGPGTFQAALFDSIYNLDSATLSRGIRATLEHDTSARVRRQLRLYVVTDHELARGRSEEEVVRSAIAGGATAIQFRAKDWDTSRMIEVGSRLREITAAADVLFIVNDRVDVAIAVNADGAHIGQEDIPIEIARQILGPSKILGVTVYNVEQAQAAQEKGADYLGTSAVFPTGTKKYISVPPLGLEGLSRIVKSTSLPVVAIGGISKDNAEQVLNTGVTGIAVVSAVVAADDIEGAARDLRAIVDRITKSTWEGSPTLTVGDVRGDRTP